MTTQSIVEQLRRSLEPVVRGEECELVDVEFIGRGKSAILRLYIDKDGGVSVEDCAQVSRQAELTLEAEEIMTEPYTLEVSSPGLTRPLKKPDDFRRSAGALACITLRKSIDTAKSQRVIGVIEKADDDCVTVSLKNSGPIIEIPFSNIAKAKLEIDF